MIMGSRKLLLYWIDFGLNMWYGKKLRKKNLKNTTTELSTWLQNFESFSWVGMIVTVLRET